MLVFVFQTPLVGRVITDVDTLDVILIDTLSRLGFRSIPTDETINSAFPCHVSSRTDFAPIATLK
jgi:hypothetical protein